MSQVLKYGVPLGERIQCEAPGCDELATRQFTINGATHIDRFSCEGHAKQITQGLSVARYVKLVVPGERNVPPLAETETKT